MQSAWLDNDQTRDGSKRRLDSTSKKIPCNRIQVVSKISTDKNLPRPLDPAPDQLNRTCFERLPLRKMPTTDGERSTRDLNMLRLMQEQLEMARKAYEDRTKVLLKDTSMVSQLAKLKARIHANEELLAAKDRLIDQLRHELRSTSPYKQRQGLVEQDSRLNSRADSMVLCGKINDMEIKFKQLIKNQNKLGHRMKDIGARVEAVQKGLLSILACKMANLQAKLQSYVETSKQRLAGIETNLEKRVRPDAAYMRVDLQYHTPGPQLQNLDSLFRWVESLREEVMAFKQKQFRYENAAVYTLKNDLQILKGAVAYLEKRIPSPNVLLKNSRSSRRTQQSALLNNRSNISNYFDDYEQAYDQNNSMSEDKFFYPMEESTRRYHSREVILLSPDRKPARGADDSFEHFTEDEDEEDLMHMRRPHIRTPK